MENSNLESEMIKKDEQSQVVSQQDYYRITTPNQALFKELEIIPGEVCPKDTTEGLYYPYTEDGLREAEGMLRKIKEAIYCYNSTSKFPQKWITKEWRDEIKRKKYIVMEKCDDLRKLGWIEEAIGSNRTLPAVFDYDPTADPVTEIIATLKALSLVNGSREQNTLTIKAAIAKLGLERFRYSCYANQIDEPEFNIVEPPHHYFTTREWLYDLIWFEDDEEPGKEYSIKSFPLALESEWDFSRNKAKIKGVSYAAVKYDFQKLVICNASLKVMIFREYAEKGVEKLKTMTEYIDTLLAEYKPKVNGQFLCIVYSPDMKSFKYKLFCPRKKSKPAK